MVLFEPHERVLEEVLADLTSSVVGAGLPPRRATAVVVVEIDPAALVLGPAVELPEVEVAGAEVVVDDVEDHRDPLPVGALDELLERAGTAVGSLHGEDVAGVVAPRPLSRKLTHGHDLDRVHAQLSQVSKARRHGRELARMVDVLLIVERAHVKLVDRELVPRRDVEAIPFPVEARIVNDGVSEGARHLTCVRVDAALLPPRRGQEEAVLVASVSLGDVDGPVTVLLGAHGVLRAIPAVERPDHGDSRSVRRPYAEGHAVPVRHRPHSLDCGQVVHGRTLAKRRSSAPACAARLRVSEPGTELSPPLILVFSCAICFSPSLTRSGLVRDCPGSIESLP